MAPDEAKIDQRKSRQAMRDLLEKREAADLANAERDAPIRERFHKYMESEGYINMQTPAPGRCYNGATQQMLWECYLKATLDERAAGSTDLLDALKAIAKWGSHPIKLAVDCGSNGVRDFYRAIARAAISKTTGEKS